MSLLGILTLPFSYYGHHLCRFLVFPDGALEEEPTQMVAMVANGGIGDVGRRHGEDAPPDEPSEGHERRPADARHSSCRPKQLAGSLGDQRQLVQIQTDT